MQSWLTRSAMGALFAYFAASPSILRNSFGIDTIGIGVFFGATAFAVFGASHRASRWGARIGAARVIGLGLLFCIAAAIISAATSLSGSLGLGVYVAAATVFLFGIGL